MPVKVALAPQFWRQFRKLPRKLREEAFEKIESFKEPANHGLLRVHKLKGRLAGRWSFSVNYRYRILFLWEERDESAILLTIGDHSLYD